MKTDNSQRLIVHEFQQIPEMTPTEAKFDGNGGIRMPQSDCSDFRLHLKRGKDSPSSYPDEDFKQQLIWLMPEDSLPRLCWCNENDQWFEVDFMPIEKP